MTKSKRNESKRKSQDTIILFPEVYSLGAIKGVSEDNEDVEQLSMIKLSFQDCLEHKLDATIRSIRMTHSIQLMQVPELVQNREDPEQNSLVVSFHHEKKWKNDKENPLLAAVITVEQIMDPDELEEFNDHIIQSESLGLIMNFADAISIVMLLDLLAIGVSPLEKKSGTIGNYYFKTVYYGEFQPALPSAFDPLIHALEHHRKTSSSYTSGDSIDLTGLLPDIFA